MLNSRNRVLNPYFLIITTLMLKDFLQIIRSQNKLPFPQKKIIVFDIWAVTRDFQQYGILTSVVSDGPVQPPFKRRNSKWCSVSRLTLIEYSSNNQRLWSDCAYAQADLRLCWSHKPLCWKSHVAADFYRTIFMGNPALRLFEVLEVLSRYFHFWH